MPQEPKTAEEWAKHYLCSILGGRSGLDYTEIRAQAFREAAELVESYEDLETEEQNHAGFYAKKLRQLTIGLNIPKTNPMNPNEPIPEAKEAAETLAAEVGISYSPDYLYTVISSACDEYAKRVSTVTVGQQRALQEEVQQLQQQLVELQRENEELKKWLSERPSETLYQNAIHRAEKAEKELAEVREISAEYVKRTDPIADDLENMSDELSILRADVKPLLGLVKEVMTSHRDRESVGYNECDKPGEQCEWCRQAQVFISAHPEFSKP